MCREGDKTVNNTAAAYELAKTLKMMEPATKSWKIYATNNTKLVLGGW